MRNAAIGIGLYTMYTLVKTYICRGYLQIACIDLSRGSHPALWYVTWDPSQPIATRPLAIRKDGTWFAYGWDLTKNICEVFGPADYIRTAYTYSPYGQVSASGDVTQPIQWSSEFYDAEPALVYYNYRHYNPTNGKWLGRDKIGERENFLLYKMVGNNPIHNMDVIGNAGYTKIACCVLRNLEKGDVDGAPQCVQDEIERIIKNFLHITALTCCVGPSALMGIGRSIVNGALQSIKNTSPKPCCP